MVLLYTSNFQKILNYFTFKESQANEFPKSPICLQIKLIEFMIKHTYIELHTIKQFKITITSNELCRKQYLC